MHNFASGFLIGIDVGTTSVKGILINAAGEALASSATEYELDSGADGFCELHPDVYWDITCKAVKELTKNARIDSSEVKGIAFSSQGETFIVVDQDGIPLRNAIVWLDNRSGEEAKMIENYFGNQQIMDVTGQPEVVPLWPATRILWLQKHEPEIFRQAHKFLLVEDYLLFKLTGKYHSEHSLVSSTLYFDIVKKDWWTEMLDFLNISQEQLPQLNASGISIGNITAKASTETGLSTSTQCITGAYDHPAGAIGYGSVNVGDVTLTIGGSMAMCVALDKPVNDLSIKLPCQCHAVNDLYFLLPYGQTAGMVLRWFRDEFCKEEIELAKLKGVDPYDLMVALAENIPIGVSGLVMLPHLMGAGSPEFNSNAKGVFAGIQMGMTKGHMVRAILESVVCMINRNLQIIADKGLVLNKIYVLGGGSKSKLWLQMLADMTGLIVHTQMVSNGAANGAAMLAGVGSGLFTNLHSACSLSVKSQSSFEPNPMLHEQYKIVYNRYLNLYKSLEMYW